MKPIPVAALALALVTLTGCVTAPPKDQNNLCSIYRQYPAWYKDSVAMQERWGTPVHVAMAIMKQESSFVADALPPRAYLLWVIPWGRVSPSYGYAQAQPPRGVTLKPAWAVPARATISRTPSCLSVGTPPEPSGNWEYPSGIPTTSTWRITKAGGLQSQYVSGQTLVNAGGAKSRAAIQNLRCSAWPVSG